VTLVTEEASTCEPVGLAAIVVQIVAITDLGGLLFSVALVTVALHAAILLYGDGVIFVRHRWRLLFPSPIEGVYIFVDSSFGWNLSITGDTQVTA
jgi:hypothetical protein